MKCEELLKELGQISDLFDRGDSSDCGKLVRDLMLRIKAEPEPEVLAEVDGAAWVWLRPGPLYLYELENQDQVELAPHVDAGSGGRRINVHVTITKPVAIIALKEIGRTQ